MQHPPSPATTIAAALAARAEEVCRRYLPNGRRLWPLLDLRRPRRRSRTLALRSPLRLRQAGGSWTDAATGRARRPARPDPLPHQRADRCALALDEARSLPRACRLRRQQLRTRLTTRPRPRAACGGAAARSTGSHAERYLHARGLSRCRFAGAALPPRASLSRRRVGGPVSGAGRRRHRRRRRDYSACSAPGSIRSLPPRPTSATPRKALGRIHGPRGALRRAFRPRSARRRRGDRDGALAGRRRAGDHGGRRALGREPSARFAPPSGLAHLVIARDNDEDGALAGRAPCPALRAGGRRRDGDRSCRQRLQRRPGRHRPGGAARALRAAVSRRLRLGLSGRRGFPVRGRKTEAEGRASRPGERRE